MLDNENFQHSDCALYPRLLQEAKEDAANATCRGLEGGLDWLLVGLWRGEKKKWAVGRKSHRLSVASRGCRENCAHGLPPVGK